MTEHPQEPVRPRRESSDGGVPRGTGTGLPGEHNAARNRAASSTVAVPGEERQDTRAARATVETD